MLILECLPRLKVLSWVGFVSKALAVLLGVCFRVSLLSPGFDGHSETCGLWPVGVVFI